jgi:hypothetical protein
MTQATLVSNGLEAIKFYVGRDDELYISTDDSFFEESFMINAIVTSEEYHRFIKKIESLVRSSLEYKIYLGYLKNELKMNSCSFFPNLDISTNEITLEMHHAPFTLYQIIDIVLTHRLSRRQAITSLIIADEILHLHTLNLIGLIPLTKSVHKLVHNKTILIHPAQIHGNWLEFLRSYPDGITEELIELTINFLKISEDDVLNSSTKLDASTSLPNFQTTTIPTMQQIQALLLQ